MWLKIVKEQVLVNGAARKEIVHRRGLHQGDLLFPLLFVLVADGLNKILSNAVGQGTIKGLPGNSIFITLQYADDTLIFEN